MQLPNPRKARAYTFENRLVSGKRTKEIQRVSEGEVIDGVTSANIDLLAGKVSDFTVSFKRDVILCKLQILPMTVSKFA